MASEPQASGNLQPERFKYRLRFAKAGDLRLVSHHDLMHCCERLFRRAVIPIAFSQGFHPTPRMVFGLSLSLGVMGSNEVLEIELTRAMPEGDLLEALRRHAPAGLLFHQVRRLLPGAKAQVTRAFYRIVLPDPPADVPRRCQELLAQEHLWTQRHKPYRRRVDIRPFLQEISVVAGTDGADGRAGPLLLQFALWVTAFGTGKAEEVLRHLGLEDQLEKGGVLERCDLELADEAGPDAPRPPQVDPKQIIADVGADIAVPVPREAGEPARPTSLIEGPLSFET
jgi:radical SAM-linked protein